MNRTIKPLQWVPSTDSRNVTVARGYCFTARIATNVIWLETFSQKYDFHSLSKLLDEDWAMSGSMNEWVEQKYADHIRSIEDEIYSPVEEPTNISKNELNGLTWVKHGYEKWESRPDEYTKYCVWASGLGWFYSIEKGGENQTCRERSGSCVNELDGKTICADDYRDNA